MLALLLALRPRQWTKNLALFVGIVFAQQLFSPALFGRMMRELGSRSASAVPQPAICGRRRGSMTSDRIRKEGPIAARFDSR